MALSTDFKDDVLASSNSKRKYNMIHNPDGTVSFEDVTVYSQEGSDFGAKEVNEEREEINKHTTLLGDTDISSIEDGTVTGALAGLNGNIKTQSFTAPVILPGKGDGSVNMGSLNIPTGYTYIGVISKDSDYGDQFLCSFQRYGDHIHAVVRNVYVNQLSGDVSCTALFSKN